MTRTNGRAPGEVLRRAGVALAVSAALWAVLIVAGWLVWRVVFG